MEYASKGVGNAGLATGIIGTTLGALNGMGGIGSLFAPPPRHESDEFVTRYEANMMKELTEKDRQIALLEADKYTDNKFIDFAEKVDRRFAAVEAQLGQQAVWNATQTGLIGCLQSQIAQLQSLTKIVVPNTNVMPGWGNVNITPATTSPTNG